MPPKGQVFGQIESAILTGGFGQGEMLPSERALAQRYKVTRTTIRRALAKLSLAGLIVNQPRIGYRVISSVRNGQMSRVRIVGVIWRNIPQSASSANFLAKLESGLAETGHALMLADSGYDAERENEAIRRLRAAGMDALIISPARKGSRSTELEKWIRNRQPIVLHGHPSLWLIPDELVAQCDMVDTDNRQGIRELLNFLHVLGHKNVGYVGCEPTEGSERFKAFIDLVAENGMHTEPGWQVGGPLTGILDGPAAVAQLMASPRLPTAILCSHDRAAVALISALREKGIRCPEDISVTGFENEFPEGPKSEYELTTIDFAIENQGAEMIRLLAKQFSGDTTHPEQVRLPVKLVVRRSACPPRA